MEQAKRYRCGSSVSPVCDRGEGPAPRAKCRFCKADLVVSLGLWGVVEYRRDGRYMRPEAFWLFRSLTHAQRAADRENAAGTHAVGMVARWFPG